MVHGICRMNHSIHCVNHGTRRMTHSTGRMNHGTLRMNHGIGRMNHRTKYKNHCTRRMNNCTRRMNHSPLGSNYRGAEFKDGEAGMAVPSAICSGDAVGISVDANPYEPHLLGGTMAHMIGHNIGMDHDDGRKYIPLVNYERKRLLL